MAKKCKLKNKAILFTRIPVPGRCKTRLANVLSDEQCGELSKAFIFDELDVLDRVCDEVFVYYDAPPDIEKLAFQNFKTLVKHDRHEIKAQMGSDIFEKMSNAFKDCFEARGSANYILVGSDLPTLDELTVIESFRDLESSDIVLRRSVDGGYFLIGMSRFSDVPFSIDAVDGASDVADKTTEAVLRGSLSVSSMTQSDVFDIDTQYDLDLLIKNRERLLNKSSKTFAFLENLVTSSEV